MLANIWLKQNGAVPIHWPEETIGCESVIRTEYINAIKAADAGDLSLLTALHEKYQGSSQSTMLPSRLRSRRSSLTASFFTRVTSQSP
jgi:hypothetical protein